MSYCTLYVFRGGVPDSTHQYPNSWGGAALIWDALFNRYLKDPSREYDSWLSRYASDPNQGKPLWDLADDDKLLSCERIILMTTFDGAIIRHKDFRRFAGHLIEFLAFYSPPAGRVCHLREWYQVAEALAEDETVDAIGFRMTSVAEDHWFTSDEETYDIIPYNLNAQDDHFDIYERLAGVQQGDHDGKTRARSDSDEVGAQEEGHLPAHEVEALRAGAPDRDESAADGQPAESAPQPGTTV